MLCKEGHGLQALLHDYPIDLVLNLHRASLENQKAELMGQTLGFSVAVMDALDAAFNSRKGKIMENWLKAMEGDRNLPIEDKRQHPPPALSHSARAFFLGMPRRKKVTDHG